MSEQTTLDVVPREDPEDVVRRAIAEHEPFAIVALCSGGHDSTVLAHRMRDHYERLVFIDTGTAIDEPGVQSVREFVVEFAEWLDKPLQVLDAGDAYEQLIVDMGFPGPGQHHRAYARLKERQLEAMLRDAKLGRIRTDRLLALSGVRRGESQRRRARQSITRRWSLAFANPLIDWTDAEMRAYRAEHGLPESEVAALLHRSGECNCGAFASPGEREMLASLFPTWWQRIERLERMARELGHAGCVWGERPPSDRELPRPSGPLCTDCEPLTLL